MFWCAVGSCFLAGIAATVLATLVGLIWDPFEQALWNGLGCGIGTSLGSFIAYVIIVLFEMVH